MKNLGSNEIFALAQQFQDIHLGEPGERYKEEDILRRLLSYSTDQVALNIARFHSYLQGDFHQSRFMRLLEMRSSSAEQGQSPSSLLRWFENIDPIHIKRIAITEIFPSGTVIGIAILFYHGYPCVRAGVQTLFNEQLVHWHDLFGEPRWNFDDHPSSGQYNSRWIEREELLNRLRAGDIMESSS